MKKNQLFLLSASILLLGFTALKAQKKPVENQVKKILYFNPEVEPNLEEIKEPTNNAFFGAVSDKISNRRNRLMRTETQMPYDSIDTKTIIEYGKNNDADFIVVPKIKYFKVGLGKYVFSNQVLVSMKVFDANGNLLTSSQYDTYRKNMRLLGSTENSIKIGTNGAMKTIFQELKKLKTVSENTF
jgi:hypothetical protein